jgi:predicted ABC-type ATPase
VRPIDEPPAPGRGGSADLAERQARLDARSPSSAGYPVDAGHHLTDAQHLEHVAEVKDRIADGKAARLDSQFAHTIDDAHEVWTDERSAAHDRLLDDLYGRASSVPCEYKAIMAGGLPGAGKTTVLTRYADIDLSQYLVINPDTIKEEMAHRGLVPQIAGLTPMEATELVHEEASALAKRLATRAQADGRNITWDFTMCNAETTSNRIESLQASGYSAVRGVFVDVGIDDSVKRADARHREGYEQYRAGQGPGGRFIPEELIRAQADPDWGSRNRANFEQLKDKFSAWSLYDNSGLAPVLTAARDRKELVA